MKSDECNALLLLLIFLMWLRRVSTSCCRLLHRLHRHLLIVKAEARYVARWKEAASESHVLRNDSRVQRVLMTRTPI